MRYALLVLLLVVLALMVMDFNNRTAELNRLREEEKIIRVQLESRDETKSALEAQIAYATSDAAVMKWAYEHHQVRPGDMPVVPIQATQVTPVPTPKPIVTPTEVSNLSHWLSLFVDLQAP
jgi:hypothetical protein